MQSNCALVICDVDYFKLYNDTYGHQVGDRCLQQVAQVLKQSIYKNGLAARYGGEEFIVLLPESGVEAGRGFARRLMARLAAESWDNDPVTVSIGLSTLDDTIFNGFQLVSMADEALYAAKRQGKNCLVVYEALQTPHSVAVEQAT